jgi:hypothetical protein
LRVDTGPQRQLDLGVEPGWRTSRRTGGRPPRRASSARNAGSPDTAAAVRSAENCTPPEREITRGASVTPSTAAKPTPNRPTLSPVRFAEARNAASAATPAPSSGAPVFAARSSFPSMLTRRYPGTPARCAASAAFCASSTSNRSA